MDTNKIKSFAKEARLSIMQSVANRLTFWGIAPNGSHGHAPEKVTGGYIYNGLPYDDATIPDKWLKVAGRVTHKQSYLDLEEEAAYTWFNRLMVIKIMEENGYIAPTLALVEGTNTPHLLQRAKMGQHNLTRPGDISKLTDYISNSEDEQALQILLIHLFNTQPVLQVIFGNVPTYMDLLLPTNLLATDGFLTKLDQNDSITSEMYREVELIGWLYQFYISDKKDEVFTGFKKNKKARAEDIPAATQIFTPKWIVKYMVENTVGKIYLDYEQDSDLQAKMKYLVTSETEGQEGSTSSEAVRNSKFQIRNLEDLSLLDPASGSGHILVVGFELLMDMYREQGYTKKKAVKLILEHNLYGLDIDDRAMQLARLAILLKAASYDDSILQDDIPLPHIYAFPTAQDFSSAEISDYLQSRDEAMITEVIEVLQLIAQGKNLGSTMQLTISEEAKTKLLAQAAKWKEDHQLGRLDAFKALFWQRLSGYIPIVEVLTQRYAAVVANPPYMGQKNMNPDLKAFVNKHYKLSKSDLFAIFMEVCMDLTKKDGLMGMINQHSWMFLASYEKLRTAFIQSYWLRDMLHLGTRTFEELSGEVVQSTAFVFQHQEPAVTGDVSTGNYYRLVDYKSVKEKENNFLSKTDFYPNIPQSNFSKIPGSPVAYWVNSRCILNFVKFPKVSDEASIVVGLQTGDNNRFVRRWHSVDCNKLGGKWLTYNKGGAFRRWYGNTDLVVNWENDGIEIKNFYDANGKRRSVIRNEQFYKKVGITWADVAAGDFSSRYTHGNAIFDVKGSSGFSNNNVKYLLGYLNSKVANYYLAMLNPTLSYQVGNIKELPFSVELEDKVTQLVDGCIEISKRDWDSRELSMNFSKIDHHSSSLEFIENFTKMKSVDFFQLYNFEKEINSIFISIHNLNEELNDDIPFNKITICQGLINFENLEKDLCNVDPSNKATYQLPLYNSIIFAQFISYTVGLMMGRYRLDRPGLIIAHPDPSAEELAPYEYNGVTVDIDDDAIIPLMGKDCNFQDDILVRLDHILTAIWGKDTLTENKNFMQECLEMPLHKFVTEKFWPYHYKTMYKKKPIYWLFTSDPKKPQKAAFKVLVYMHRMDRFTLSKIRNQYLHPHQEHLQSQYDALSARVETLTKDEAKRLDLLGKQIIECRDFDDRLKVLANQQITFDLDDGVTENYKLFAGVVGELK